MHYASLETIFQTTLLKGKIRNRKGKCVRMRETEKKNDTGRPEVRG